MKLIEKYDNLLISQTFSKSRAMAGMRIGSAIGNEALIRYLNDVKYSFNSYTMDMLTIKLATASINDREYFEKTVEKVINTREWTKKELKRLGFVFGDSKSNFIFAKHPKYSGVELFNELKKAGIYVRHFSKPEKINEYLRISIGTDEQLKQLIAFFESYIGG